MVEVAVHASHVDQALRTLKKKMQREGIYRKVKLERNYEKPSEAKVRKRAESQRRMSKLARRKMFED